MSQLRIVALTLSCIFGFIGIGEAQTSRPKSSVRDNKWAVVKIDSTYQVIEASKVKALKKEVANGDKAKLKAWKKAKSEARKNRSGFKTPKPAKTKFKLISSRFTSKSKATAHKLELEAKDRKKRERAKRARSRPQSRPRS